MKKFLIIFIALSFVNSDGYSQSDADKVRKELAPMLGQNSFGTDFWIPIPELMNGNYYESFGITINTLNENEVRITNESNNLDITQNVNAFDEYVQNIPYWKYNRYNPHDMYEKRISYLAENSAIHIESEYPISVQTYNIYNGQKNASNALPTNSLGKEFMLQTYFSTKNRPSQPPSVSITAPYDNTIVELKLSNYNKSLKVIFENGDSLLAGENKKITLNEGDVLHIFSCDSIGDLSGSTLKSSKPINVLYSQYALDRPWGSWSADDVHSVIYPIEYWGKRYFVPTFRELNMFPTVRIFALEDDTKIFRNGVYWTTINNSNENEIFESHIWTDRDRNSTGGIVSPTIITSDKPISLMCFANYKLNRDSLYYVARNMNVLPPYEQSSNYAYFSLNSSHHGYVTKGEYTVQKLELYFELDKDLEIPSDMEFLKTEYNDKNQIWKSIKDYYSTDYTAIKLEEKYYAALEIKLPDSCAFYIKSKNTKFSGLVYKTYLDYTGVKDGATRTLEHFSFPISHNAIELTTDENNIPIISLSQNNSGNKVTGIVYDGLQNSSKLAQLFMLKEYSRNFNFEIISADKGFITDSDGNSFVAGLPVQLEFELNKIDIDKDAFAVIYACDRAGNDTLVFINEDKFTSIESKPSLAQYITITQSNIEVLPQALTDGFTELLVFDINGNRLLNSDIVSQRNITLSQLASGTYFATLKNGERIVTQKFVVVK